MGQVHVESVQVGRLPEMVAALGRAGFDVDLIETKDGETQRYRCRRGNREIILGVSSGHSDLDEIFVVLAHPPYTAWPWRWRGDIRFFNEVTEVLDGFHYRD